MIYQQITEAVWQETTYKWKEGFKEKDLSTHFRSGGSVKTGLFTSPKKKSQNQVAPAGYYVEIDGRVDFPKEVNAQDQDMVELIKEVTGLHSPKFSNRVIWDKPEKRTLLYCYLEITQKDDYYLLHSYENGELKFKYRLNGASLESVYDFNPFEEAGTPLREDGIPTYLELEVVFWGTDFHLEIADFWKEVFTPDEIKWQIKVREFLREVCGEPCVEEFKEYTCVNARWILYAGFAIGRFEEYHEPISRIRHLVDNWEKLTIPEIPNFDKIGIDILEKFPMPEPYDWVQRARDRAIQKSKSGSYVS